MDCKINWTFRAWLSFENNIQYLQENWTDKEINKFVTAVDKKIFNLSKHPRIGSPRNKRNTNIRFTLINKRIALLYKHKPLRNEIDLLVFWNMYQNPGKLRAK